MKDEEFVRMEHKRNRIIDDLESKGYPVEAEKLRTACEHWSRLDYTKEDHYENPLPPESVKQAAEFIMKMPRMSAPVPDIKSNNERGPKCIKINYRGDYPLIPRLAELTLFFKGKEGIKYDMFIDAVHDTNAAGIPIHVIPCTSKNGTVKSVNAAVGKAKRFFEKRPKSPPVSIKYMPLTPLIRRMLDERHITITDLESLERAVSRIYFTADGMSVEDYKPEIPKTGIPEIDRFADRFKEKYARMIKVMPKHRTSILAGLYPLSRLLYVSYPKFYRDIVALMPHGVFHDCAKAANVTVCWRCGVDDEIIKKSRNKNFQLMCLKCKSVVEHNNVERNDTEQKPTTITI